MSELLNRTCNLNKLPILLVESHYLTQLPNNIGNLISLKVVKLNQDQLARLPDFVKYLQEPNFLDLQKKNILNILKTLYKLVIPKRIDRHGNFYNAMHILIKNMPCKNHRDNMYDPTIMKYSNVKNDKSKFNNNYYKCAKKTSMKTEFSSLSSPCDETENWDFSDDSTDEYDPTVYKEPRMKRIDVPFGIYGPPGGIFCPGDSHPPSIREQLYQIKYQQNSTADCYDKSEEGQFDDA
ncbi:uncharacterized protein LOC107267146 isoform X2 [Cephus cinctus]|nr:uncharacterized protein LOC107267146 isoform X2 [Cephus cinctus]